jgi:hypothetical protein
MTMALLGEGLTTRHGGISLSGRERPKGGES